MDAVAEIRGFNRFYAGRIGRLEEHLPASDFTLAEARVIHELATAGDQPAAALCRRLGMDKAHLSRIAARFRSRGLIEAKPGPGQGRRPLALTEAGRAAFIAADQSSRARMEQFLAPLGPEAQETLVAALRQVRRTVERNKGRAAQVRLRRPGPGDLGWVIHRQAQLYHRDYGWDWTFEGLVAEILAGFVAGFDAGREDAWIAELEGRIVGSVFLMKTETPDIARLRLLYVEREARGQGIGVRLVAACIERAHALGYRQITLWTNDALVSARRIYQAAGFRMVKVEAHQSFGKDLVEQTWILDLVD
jgi:DNA-binding MarR family transcriptional regulator/GNAT superfamily N-acetyltransferase